MQLPEFIEAFGDAINARLVDLYPPVYDAATRATCGIDLGRLGRRPLGAQADAIRAAALSIRRNPGTNIVGEMGVGKSMCAAAAAYLSGRRSILILCPPHLVRKWVREVRQTVPGARPTIVSRIADLERLRSVDDGFATLVGRGGQPAFVSVPRFVILSRERAKLGYPWRPAYVTRAARDRDRGGHREALPCCGACLTPILDQDGLSVAPAALAARKHRCAACDEPLWQAGGASGGRATARHRYPLAEYICERLPGFFDLLLVDELHEFKARGSAQGIAMGQLAEAIGTVLTCTGTLMGGYASTLFSLLWRVNRRFRAEFAYGDEDKFVARYGIIERQFRKEGGDEHVEDGRRSRRRLYLARVKERPSISPAVLFHLIDSAIFLRLRDVANDLPPYQEHIVTIPLDREGAGAVSGDGGESDPPGVTQHDAYHQLATTLRAEVQRALASGGKSRLLGAYLQALLAFPDGCTRGEVVLDRATGRVVAEAPALPADRVYPKERALLELALRERDRGRRVLVYAVHTATRDITPRLRAVLAGAGLRVAVLKAATVKPEAREAWVARQVAAGLDVLIAPPRCVQTGLDYVEYRPASSLAVRSGAGPRGRAARVPGLACADAPAQANPGWKGPTRRGSSAAHSGRSSVRAHLLKDPKSALDNHPHVVGVVLDNEREDVDDAVGEADGVFRRGRDGRETLTEPVPLRRRHIGVPPDEQARQVDGARPAARRREIDDRHHPAVMHQYIFGQKIPMHDIGSGERGRGEGLGALEERGKEPSGCWREGAEGFRPARRAGEHHLTGIPRPVGPTAPARERLRRLQIVEGEEVVEASGRKRRRHRCPDDEFLDLVPPAIRADTQGEVAWGGVADRAQARRDLLGLPQAAKPMAVRPELQDGLPAACIAQLVGTARPADALAAQGVCRVIVSVEVGEQVRDIHVGMLSQTRGRGLRRRSWR